MPLAQFFGESKTDSHPFPSNFLEPQMIIPFPWEGFSSKRGRRPRRERLLFADFVLAYRPGKAEEAYEAVAEKYGISVESVKRQIARGRRRGKKMDA
jgi:hypothetical protein